jgi:SAM-dependent methyltransferase
MNRGEVAKRTEELGMKQAWNHSIELTDGVFTCTPNQVSLGKNLIKWERMKGFIKSFSCENKRVLDIGCNDGFFSLKLAELGANVVALEASPERVEKAKFVFETRNVSKQIKLINTNIFDYPLDTLGYFDLVLCMGFVHRVPDPFTIFSKLVPLADICLLEFKAFPEYAYDRPYVMFYGKRSDPQDSFSTCYFIPSLQAVIGMAKGVGFGYYGIIGNPDSRRVMMVVSQKNLPILNELNSFKRANTFYLLSKFAKRFAVDVFKTLRGDFSKEYDS